MTSEYEINPSWIEPEVHLFCVRENISEHMKDNWTFQRLFVCVAVHEPCVFFYDHVWTSGPVDTEQPVYWILSELLTSQAQVLP